MSLRFFFCAT